MLDHTVVPDHVVALDLELNQPSGRIVQVGAVVGQLSTGAVVGEFSAFVNPGEALDPRIAKLCAISPQVLAAAPRLDVAYQQLAAWLAPWAASRHLNALTWGGGDTDHLRSALGLDRDRWLFGRRWTDVKTVYTAWRMRHGAPPVGGLARSMTKLGLTFQGRKHNAVDDARNTFRMYVALLKQFQPAVSTQLAA